MFVRFSYTVQTSRLGESKFAINGGGDGSLPVRVETAPIEPVAFILNIAFAPGEFLPKTGGLIWLDGGPAEFLDQKTATASA